MTIVKFGARVVSPFLWTISFDCRSRPRKMRVEKLSRSFVCCCNDDIHCSGRFPGWRSSGNSTSLRVPPQLAYGPAPLMVSSMSRTEWCSKAMIITHLSPSCSQYEVIRNSNGSVVGQLIRPALTIQGFYNMTVAVCWYILFQKSAALSWHQQYQRPKTASAYVQLKL